MKTVIPVVGPEIKPALTAIFDDLDLVVHFGLSVDADKHRTEHVDPTAEEFSATDSRIVSIAMCGMKVDWHEANAVEEHPYRWSYSSVAYWVESAFDGPSRYPPCDKCLRVFYKGDE